MSNIFTLLNLLCRPAKAGGTDLLVPYQKAFAETIVGDSSRPALAFRRGRVALWTILRAAGLNQGDEVILPAYTCGVVPTAVKFAGGHCIYVDVETGGFNASVQQIAEAITKNTRAIICQHTYGIPQPVQKFRSLIAGRQINLIEDCCQLICHDWRYEGVDTNGDAAFFSTQWSKPFSTGLGGMAVFFNNNLYAASCDTLATFSNKQERKEARSLAAQMLLYSLTVRPRTKALIARLYRWAQRTGMVQGSTSAKEYGDNMPSDYVGGATNIHAVLGMEQLRQWQRNVSHRRMLTEFYLGHLSDLGVDITPMTAGADNPVLWGVPLFVKNVEQILGRASRAGLPIANWFGGPPVHIAPSTAKRYDYQIGQCPRSEWMITREIHLPTAPSVTLKQAEGAVKLIKQYARITNY
jgi:perosamine synthetase